MGDETRKLEVVWRGGKLGRKGSKDPEKRMRMLEQERGWIKRKIEIAESTAEIDALIKEAMELILRERRMGGERTGIDSRDAILKDFLYDPTVRRAMGKRMELTADSFGHVMAIIEKIGEDVLFTTTQEALN